MTPSVDLRLTALEVVAGFPIGEQWNPPLPLEGAVEPTAALEQAMTTALLRTPCVVSFSGGRDSSAVLAMATRLARREGLPDPMPVTLRFPGAQEADETAWQEHVVRHLGLDGWVREDVDDELDLVGPVAVDVLRRHGLLWPPNTHFHQPILELARGGAILTGIDGDGLFASWRWRRAAQVLSGRLRPEPRDLARVVIALSPPAARRAIEARRPSPSLSWVRPGAMARIGAAWAAEAASEPARWDRWVGWYARRRSLQLVLASFERLASDAGVAAVHPFVDPVFLGSLVRAGGRSGLGGRTEIMRRLCAGLLPDDVISRTTKASLDAPFWNRHSRAFVSTWDGGGVDLGLVDPQALLEEWSKRAPHAFSSTLLQAVWLTTMAVPPGGDR